MPVFTYSQIESWIGVAFWPFLRIGACLMVAPLFGASYVPPRLRIVLAGALTLVALPMIPPVQGLTLLSADGVITTVQQILIGVAMGFALQLMFDALNLGRTVAGQRHGTWPGVQYRSVARRSRRRRSGNCMSCLAR